MEIGKTYVIDVSQATIQSLKIIAIICLILLCTQIVKAMQPRMAGKCPGNCGKKHENIIQPKLVVDKRETESAKEKRYWQNVVADKNIKYKPFSKVEPVIILKDVEKKSAGKKSKPKKKNNKNKKEGDSQQS